MAEQYRIPEWLWELVANESDTTTAPSVESRLAVDAEAGAGPVPQVEPRLAVNVEAGAGPSSTWDESWDVEALLRELSDVLPDVTQADLDANDELENVIFGYDNKLEANTEGKYITFIKH